MMGINPTNIRSVRVLAMIDTGATGTVISAGLAAQLGINPVGIRVNPKIASMTKMSPTRHTTRL